MSDQPGIAAALSRRVVAIIAGSCLTRTFNAKYTDNMTHLLSRRRYARALDSTRTPCAVRVRPWLRDAA
jgi:hypothetical protein